ncbi:MAG: cadherin-like beta sandwich domain-containing protein, partial [Vicinamibacteria bacterium]|nr:cadherin-like beta sandwich domain-containing protein [Vicinamibacteria bacterium]
MRLACPSFLPSRPRLRALGIVAAAVLFALRPTDAAAQCVSLTTPGSAYTQNFDTLSNTAGSTTNNLTITGWFLTETGGGARDNEQYGVDTGASTTGDTYSYGSAASTERALGQLRSGTLVPNFGSCYTNNTGTTIASLQVAYTGEQWRLGTINRTDQMNFEYSTNATDLVTGTWTGVAALNFVTPDTATTGAKNGNAAADRTALSSTISSLSIANGATFWIRWADTDASGADDGLAVDDFSLTPNPGGPPPLSLSINDVALAEGNAGTTTFTFTVSLTAPANPGGVTFDIATADNTATTADNDYVANSLTGQTIPAGSSTYSFSVTVNGDAVIEPNQTFFVNITNVTGATLVDGQGQGTINNDDVSLTPIHDIQGPGASSPVVGASVTTTGIVTGVKSNGFFLQEPDATVDADPLTSEGIFVFTSSAPPAAVALGNKVQVAGTVSEFVPSADPLQPPLTEITGPAVVLLSAGNPLPAPVTLTPSFPDPGGAHDQLERLEGMRVSIASLTVTGATAGNVSETNATATSTGVFYGVVTGVARPFREPGIQAPDPAPAGAIPPIPRFDSNPERIRVDSDGLVGSGAMEVGWGTTITGLVGPLDYNTRTYTVLPDPTPAPVVTGGPTPTPVTTPLGSEFTVASYNLERFFDAVNDPGIGEPVLTVTAFNNRLAKASLGIRNYLKTPDIVGIVECENLTTLQALASRISSDAIAAAQPDPLYQAFLFEGNDVGGIDVGFLVKTAIVAGATPRVTVNSVTQFGLATTILNPDSSADLLNDRPPLVLDAVINHASGATFPVVVIVNHLRSLLGVDDTSAGPNGWATAGDRVRNKRQKQAEFLANLVQTRQIANPAEHIILVGDFNAFEFNDGYGDTMNVIAGTPPPDNQTVVPGDGIDLVSPDLVNLSSTAAPSERYSYVFDGNAQSLDHALINAALSSDTLARREEHPRINGDFPETARNSTVSVTRLSDHDPIVTFFRVASFLSGNANLSNMTLSSGTLAPAFAPATTSYSATVASAVSAITVTPTAANAEAAIEVQINGGGFASVASGTPSGSLALNVGANTAQVKVTSEDASATQTYSVAIHRCAAITLSALPNGLLSAAYTATISASGGIGPYTYALTSGSLPSGLTLNGSDPAGFTGTTSATGTFNFQITATDTAAPGTCTGVRNYTVHIGSSVAAGDLVIREFRLRGPASATDEYIVVHNRATS